MRIGVWVPLKYVQSVKIYYNQVSKRLLEMGVTFVPFSMGEGLPGDVDLYWDPTCTGGKNPSRKLLQAKRPIVATVHGAANFALPHHYTYKGLYQQIKGYFINAKRLYLWRRLRHRMDGIITVSNFAKEEIARELALDPNIITPIHHGFDSNIFFPPEKSDRDYMFHVSVYQPVKNVEMLLEAYGMIAEERRLPLVMVVPGYPGEIKVPKVRLIKEPIPQKKVAEYMQGARAFLLPSVRESFGLPLIEAMACGTPVITTYGSACEEVTEGAGIHCHPHNRSEWQKAMEGIMQDDELFQELSMLSLMKARQFSWDKCAGEHHDFFKKILESQLA